MSAPPSQLRQATLLAQPFDPSLIMRKPGGRGADYVSHPVVQQRFMFVTGVPSTQIKRELYGLCRKPELGQVLVSVLMRMEVVVDGELKVAEEYGSCEHPENESHDGERAKKAASDAYKRCAMRCGGVGLHLWCKGAYTLGDRMRAQDMKKDAELIESAAHDTDSEPEPLSEQFDDLRAATKKLADPTPVVEWVKEQKITRGSLTAEQADEWQSRIELTASFVPDPEPVG